MSGAVVASDVAPLLQVKALRVHSAQGPLVDGIDLHLARGECLAIVGESGSGKTMAARAVLGLLPPGVRVSSGDILLDGEDLLQATPRRLRALRGAQIGMVFQEPMVSLNPAQRIGTQMAEGLRLHTTLSAAQIEERCVAMLDRIQISQPRRCLRAYPHEFSGGMRQRIMLASVMLLEPRLLIADEPTTALDTLVQAEVLDLMQELARDSGTAVLLITHNLGLVARYAQRAVVMRKGQVVESGGAAQLVRAPTHAYTQALVDAMPRRGTEKSVPPGEGPALIEVRNLRLSYPGARSGLFGRRPPTLALRGVDLDIHPGQTLAVVGGSGSGKTTLGRALLHLVPPSAGEVRYRGQPVSAADPAGLRRFRLACQLVFQDPYSSLDPRQRIGDIVDEPLKLVQGLDAAARARRVAEVLDEVGLAGFAQRLPHELSGGQRQRVAIARAIVRRPAFVVADEPVSALDMSIQAQVLALFRTLQRQHGFACLFISHDLGAVEQMADHVLVMQHGVVVERGTRDAVFDHPQHAYTRALLAASPRIAG